MIGTMPQYDCSVCNGVGTVPRVLATFADAAALREEMYQATWFTEPEDNLAAVLAALGVSDEQA